MKLASIALLLLLASSHAAEHRHWFASQHAWGERTGFFLDLENKADGDAPLTPEGMQLILGVGDGRNWRFDRARPEWRLDHEYTVRAVIGEGRSELWLDGERVVGSEGGFAPADGQRLALNEGPSWADAERTYWVVQGDTVLTSGDDRVAGSFPPGPDQPALRLFTKPQPQRLDWQPAADRPLTIETRFRLVPRPNPAELAPFIDRYGQMIQADWPGKVRSDEQLVAALADERERLAAMGKPEGFDAYGGSTTAGWTSDATGFFRLEQRDGVWWLISPAGNPCFFTGMSSAPGLNWPATPTHGRESYFAWLPPREEPYRGAWHRNPWGAGDPGEYVVLHLPNLVRRYGADDWQDEATAQTIERLRTWGFHGGKWGVPPGMVGAPVLRLSGVAKLARHPDVFDPAIRERIEAVLREQIEPRRDDPLVLGWSVGNEYDEIINLAEIREIVGMPADTPAKVALVEHVLAERYDGDIAKLSAAWGADGPTKAAVLAAAVQPPDDDLEAMRHHYAHAYYGLLYDTIKRIDPNHLYLGNWIVPGWWENESDWLLIGEHVDVIGYDRYSFEYKDERLTRLMAATDKPVLLGEFSFPPHYDGNRGYGTYGAVWATDEAEAGDLYAQRLDAAARDPYCVGAVWFQYRDQPLTGRGPGTGPDPVYGEHYAFGVVDYTDRPKWPLVERMRAANLQAVEWRMDAAERP